MIPCAQNKELTVLNTYLHKHKFVFFLYFFAQHDVVRMALFYKSLNNDIYPAELSHINCISHLSLETMQKYS